ncbi:MAG: DsbA family protein [Rhizobiales bacterium]|nr:DsbA family protein [Hyphomicrobiales bacterium]
MKIRRLVLAAAGVIALAGAVPAIAAEATPAPMSSAADGLTAAQRADVEGVIKDYLMAHPEVIKDAMDELQRRQDAAEAAQQVSAISDNSSALFSSKRQVVLGNPKGDVTLVEFFDYNCGYCKRAHADLKELLANDKNLRVVLKEFPVLGDGSVEAANVAVAVNIVAPDKYWAFHDAMLTERGQANGEKAIAVAEEIGIDKAKLIAAMKSPEIKATIAESYDLANKLALTGTPSYVTPKEVVVGAVGYDALKEKIGVARCGQPTCS